MNSTIKNSMEKITKEELSERNENCEKNFVSIALHIK